MKNVNIMDTLAPRPPFNPAKKNNSVDFGTPKVVNTLKYKTIHHG